MENTTASTSNTQPNKKMKACKHCGVLIAKSAKVCPKCGGKNNPPIYTRPWFIILAIVIVIGLGSSMGKGSKSSSGSTNTESKDTSSVKKEDVTTEEKIEYTPVTVSEMVSDLESNAMKAESKYKGQYIEITGELSNIDSSGKYISLSPEEFSMYNVQCYLKSDEQKEKVMEMTKGDKVTLRGKCKDVGEIMGYSLDIDSID